MLLIGLVVGVDYSPLYLERESEERARGASPEQALAVAAATSGRSVRCWPRSPCSRPERGQGEGGGVWRA